MKGVADELCVYMKTMKHICPQDA